MSENQQDEVEGYSKPEPLSEPEPTPLRHPEGTEPLTLKDLRERLKPYAEEIRLNGEAIESLTSNAKYFALVAMVALLLATICGLSLVHLLRMHSENGE